MTADKQIKASIPANTISSINILGVQVSAIDMSMAASVIDGWIQNREKQYVCVTNVYCIIEGRRKPALREVYQQAGLRTPDGMPLVWIAHLKKLSHVRRVYGPDLMTRLCAVKGYRHFLYGGSERALAALADKLGKQFAGFILAGTFSPPFRDLTSDEDAMTVSLMNDSQADIIWIALGTPRQDVWMYDHRLRLNAPVLIGVGAAFDFLSGYKRQAPRWMQQHGLEWLFRLISEPRRLWRRYLTDSPMFLLMFMLQLSHLRQYDALPADKNHNDRYSSDRSENTGDH